MGARTPWVGNAVGLQGQSNEGGIQSGVDLNNWTEQAGSTAGARCFFGSSHMSSRARGKDRKLQEAKAGAVSRAAGGGAGQRVGIRANGV